LIEGAPTPTEKGYVLPQSDKPMSIENHKNFKEPRAVCHLARSEMGEPGVSSKNAVLLKL